ncbi:trypsin-like cysteine/serine peptidase domain-containing protein [Syncephalis fuscata]|nr:trypsin-like cysteine/serine peptidase domain-containing protein [Syncephalis fuscata]
MTKATPFNPVMKIAGGYRTTITEFPFAVRLLRTQNYICSGSIIGDRWILTAAHCIIDIDESKKTKRVVIRDPSKYAINIGLNSDVNPNSIVSKNVYAHPKYNWNTARYDVGLLELSQPIKFTDAIQSVKLMKDESKLPVNQMLTVVGWGKEQAHKFATKLNRIELPNGSPEFCAKADGNYLTYRDQLMCTAYAPRKVICGGDSGGPLLIKVANSNGAVGKRAAASWLQAGITSYTQNTLRRDSRICGEEGNVGFYARVDYFIPWIAKTTRLPIDQFTASLPRNV